MEMSYPAVIILISNNDCDRQSISKVCRIPWLSLFGSAFMIWVYIRSRVLTWKMPRRDRRSVTSAAWRRVGRRSDSIKGPRGPPYNTSEGGVKPHFRLVDLVVQLSVLELLDFVVRAMWWARDGGFAFAPFIINVHAECCITHIWAGRWSDGCTRFEVLYNHERTYLQS
jgi:hypothetical protein